MSSFERFWTYLYRDIFQEDDFKFTVYGTAIWMSLVFYVACGLLAWVDLTGSPKWILRYKIQEGINEPVDPKKFWHAFRVATFNQLVISFSFLWGLYYFQKAAGCSCKPEDLPNIFTVIRDIIGIIIVEEIGFYYFHRLAHWGPLYKHIHKQHHEWTAPMGFICVYCHPLEHIVCNLLPFTAGTVIMKTHMATAIFWYTFAMLSTILGHSGYHFPIMRSSESHDYHHLKFNVNYGAIGFLDWLHGTDKPFRNTIQFKRHKTLYGLTPMSVQYPDAKNKNN